MQELITFVSHLSTLVPTSVELAVLGPVVEMILHLIPSQKPLSILTLLAQVFVAIGGFLTQVGTATESVIPQNLTAPPVTAATPAALSK